MAQYHKLVIVGNVGKDAEMRYTSAGVPVSSFNVAVNKTWMDQDGAKHEKTTWFRVTCWRKQAEIMAQYVKKGMAVLVEGEIAASAYIDKSGNAQASLELTARDVQFLGSREGNGHPAVEETEERMNDTDDGQSPF